MREILFRGKRADNGEWVEGFYAKSGEKTYILFDNDFAVSYVTMKEVDPSTVGQYTGLTDKNGTKIFEGDIVKTKSYGKDGSNGCNFNDYDVFRIAFVDASFMLVNNTREFYLTKENSASCIIIGNIHDNPELLKGG